MKNLKVFIIITIISSLSYAQGTAGTNAKFEYRSLIDLPSAGVLEKGYVGISLDVMPLGVMVSKIEVGVFDNFSFGISYGGSNIIGSGEIDFYKLPGVNLKLRVMDETEGLPALTLGFDMQGKGTFDDDINRWQIKSPGFYAAASKNFEFFGYLSLHGVVNYSFERDDNDKDLNLGVGLEKTVGGKVSAVAEYDFAINDNNPLSFGDGNGYLNIGVRWSVGEGFTIGMNLRDLLDNKKLNSARADRGLFVEYIKSIF
ncbi:MAG: YjbH domain-containing protein [Melioribacteraceae bacterium]|nr:YjbH domain-containing protein [Melioribacteraceae bacterium]